MVPVLLLRLWYYRLTVELTLSQVLGLNRRDQGGQQSGNKNDGIRVKFHPSYIPKALNEKLYRVIENLKHLQTPDDPK